VGNGPPVVSEIPVCLRAAVPQLEFATEFKFQDRPISRALLARRSIWLVSYKLELVRPIFYSSRASTWHKPLILFGVG
jgi:hypothetical protein